MQFKESKIRIEEQEIGKRRASVGGQAIPARGEATTRSRQPRHPDKVCRGSRGQNHPTNHSSMTHVINQCGAKPQGD